MAFGDSQLQAIRERVPEYLERVHGITDLRRNFRCLHPGHADRHPRMGYEAQAYRVKCFSCGASGDVFEVAGWDAGASAFPDKARAAADALGISLDAQAPSYRPMKRAVAKKPARRKPLPVGGEDVSEAVFAALCNLHEPCGAHALGYLHGRGFTDEDICRSGWGWVGHPSDVCPGGFENAPRCEGGYLCLPFPDSECFGSVRYAVFRACEGGAGPKERKPKGAVAPIWKEYLLRGEGACGGSVCIAEGIFDAASLPILTGIQACAMCGSNVGRILDVVADTPRKKRPKYVVATDCDEAGEAMARTLAEGFAEMGVPYSLMPPYPYGLKDANDVLRRERGCCSDGR